MAGAIYTTIKSLLFSPIALIGNIKIGKKIDKANNTLAYFEEPSETKNKVR
jgi:hypothetical protein